ncbi:hypothetical protein BJF79_13645 [Actinomadura sp. CNU-125]|uniref:DUF6011 domain-containing protein n=1 Tax=Actinomadura sp. CNU-125 TaxID=1904961 RepID=UPI000966B181|nr:DUF6011 domain-containing protein [Actinomadura sp. CNU-125]OLT24381.1 hypothetical protein BJF79_13645 [Actinomadura sp. CNU-125]
MAKATTPKTATCRRPGCHATLTNPRSVARGIGPTCARKERQDNAARAAGIKPATLVKARELIADGGIIPIRGRRVFRAVSSDGTATYLTAPQACSCAAGLRGKHGCFHRAAATLLAA